MTRRLYYGDNLAVLRESIPNESVDLIYLDPPFNPNVNYNVLFKTPRGLASQAQIDAFRETWQWGDESARAFDEIMASNTPLAGLTRCFRSFLGENGLMAYLANMAVRLAELRRVLKPTGSLYLHCDPTASHYVKILLDAPNFFETFPCGNVRCQTSSLTNWGFSNRASSNEGDLVLDPFCGCGTAVHAAEKLKRQWIGIDVTHHAIAVIEDRMHKALPGIKFDVLGRPEDLDSARDLARRDKYQFQWWATWLLGAQGAQSYGENKKGADRGIDGLRFYKDGPRESGAIIISVKGGENIGPHMVRDLRGVMEREGAALGVLITLADPTPAMQKEAAAAGTVMTAHGRFPRIQIATVEKLLNGVQPQLPPRYEISTTEDARLIRSKLRPDPHQRQLLFGIPGGKSSDEHAEAPATPARSGRKKLSTTSAKDIQTLDLGLPKA